MARPLRATLLLVVVLTALLPVAAFAYIEYGQLLQSTERQREAERQAAALAAAMRADAAALEDSDPLLAAAETAPEDARVYLVSQDGAWREARTNETGLAPEAAQMIGTLASGASAWNDPLTGEPAVAVWGRAPAADANAVLSFPDTPVVWQPGIPLIAVLAFLASGVILLAVVLTERVVRPVLRLQRASRRLAEGEWNERVQVGGSQEVRELARSFNQMADDLARERHNLQDYIKHLDRLVADRTRSLTESTADLDAIQFTIAHELREPLRSIRMTSELALDDFHPDEAREVLEMIHRRITRLERIHLDLLRYDTLARREAPMHRVSLTRAVHRALDNVDAPRLDVEIKELPDAHGNEELLIESFVEVLRNAKEHAGEDARVVVQGHVDEEAAEAVVTFDDNGPGIPVERREDVFHLFQQLSDRAPGTGVGLAIVRRIIARHGGSLHVESAPGGGARFVVRLPLPGPGDDAAQAPVTAPRGRRF